MPKALPAEEATTNPVCDLKMILERKMLHFATNCRLTDSTCHRAAGITLRMEGTDQDSAGNSSGDRTGLSVLFRPKVPTPEAVESIGDHGSFAVTLSRPDKGWLELLQNGMAFDLAGFDGNISERLANGSFHFGFDGMANSGDCAALSLDVGPHLVSGRHMLPVVRAQMKIGLALADLHGCEGLVWQPAGVAMSPAYFKTIIGSWIGGGPFPALGLTALSLPEDGTVLSHGMRYFTGRELRVAPFAGSIAARMRVAVRLVDHLVHAEEVQEEERLLGPEGRAILIRKLRDEPLFEAALI